MKFDTARALSIVEELGGPRFAGAAGEAQQADFVAHQLAQMGLRVQRRDVTGSGLPRLAVSSASWLGFGLVMTVAMTIVWSCGNRWPTQVFGWPLFVLGGFWLVFGLGHGLRFGWKLPPYGTAPLVVARTENEGSPSCRVVFQTPLGSVSASRRQPSVWLSTKMGAVLYLFLMLDAVIARSVQRDQGFIPGSASDLRTLGAGLLGLFWLFLVARCISEARSSKEARTLGPADRTGLAVLLELARTWSPSRSPRVEIVFAAAGGQMLDFAGARAMLQSIHGESGGVPTLLVLWFAPGIGSKLIIVSRNLRDLALAAANSLWIPHRLASRSYREPELWPSLRSHGDAVSLISVSYLDEFQRKDVVDPASLQTTAQLATEIALRWAKKQQETAKS